MTSIDYDPPRYCIECGEQYDPNEDGYWGFCGESCYDEFEDSVEPE